MECTLVLGSSPQQFRAEFHSFAELEEVTRNCFGDEPVGALNFSLQLAEFGKVDIVNDATLEGAFRLARQASDVFRVLVESDAQERRQETTDYASPEVGHSKAISISFHFNPPTVEIIGDLPQQIFEAIEANIAEYCLEEKHRAVMKGLPRFQQVPTRYPLPWHRLQLPKFMFDENQQTEAMLAVMDGVKTFDRWILVPGDGSVEVDQTILADAKERQRVSLQGTFKPQKPRGNYHTSYELFYVYR